MEEIRMRDEQLTELDVTLKELFDGLPKSKRKELDLMEMKDKIHDYTNALDSFKMELRSQSATDKAVYKHKAKTYSQNLRKYKNDLEWAEAQSEKNELFDGRGEKAGQLNTNEGVMAHSLGIQKQTKDSLERTRQIVAETGDIGRETAVKLEQQTDQLENMYDDLKDINSSLDRSKKIIARMSRKMATDKVIWVMTLLVIAAVIGIVIWKLVDPSANVVVPDQLFQDGRDAVNGVRDGRGGDDSTSDTGSARRLLRLLEGAMDR